MSEKTIFTKSNFTSPNCLLSFAKWLQQQHLTHPCTNKTVNRRAHATHIKSPHTIPSYHHNYRPTSRPWCGHSSCTWHCLPHSPAWAAGSPLAHAPRCVRQGPWLGERWLPCEGWGYTPHDCSPGLEKKYGNGVWSMMNDVRFMVYGVWCACIEYGVWWCCAWLIWYVVHPMWHKKV